ncbi:MAG TPA: hypothetical protein VFB72_15105 [Verrucomicrobiae bacterium]|nr:hypothetical protein [Verrucomicrobiae bacterium]
MSFIIHWDSVESVEHWAYLFDYSGSLDFLVGAFLCYALVKRLKGHRMRNVEVLCSVLAVLAGLCWVVDGKLNHRLTDLQAKMFSDQIKAAAEGRLISDPKEEIRDFFSAVNPAILPLIDSGQKRIPVFLSSLSQSKLFNLSGRRDFEKYLAFDQTGGMMQGGSGNQYGNFINEVAPNNTRPMMSGFIFYPKDALKR